MNRDKKSEREDTELQGCNIFKYYTEDFEHLRRYIIIYFVVLPFYFLNVPKLCKLHDYLVLFLRILQSLPLM